MDNKQNNNQIKKINYVPILVLINTFIIIGYVVWNPIKNHFKKIDILSRTSILNISEAYSSCTFISDNSLGTKQEAEECHEAGDKYKYLKKRFDPLIKKNANLNCSDFIGQTEARQFYEYVGGINIFNQLKIEQENSSETLSLMLRGNVHKYDPYNLDINYDGQPCESLLK